MSELRTISHEYLNQPEIVVRPAEFEDGHAIFDIWKRSWSESGANEEIGVTADDIAEYVQNKQDNSLGIYVTDLSHRISLRSSDKYTFVAEIDGKVVGFAENDTDNQKHATISSLYVDTEAQGKGIGGKLLAASMNFWGDEQDVYIEVVDYNINAIKFYEEAGFVRFGTEKKKLTDFGDGKKLYGFDMVKRATQ